MKNIKLKPLSAFPSSNRTELVSRSLAFRDIRDYRSKIKDYEHQINQLMPFNELSTDQRVLLKQLMSKRNREIQHIEGLELKIESLTQQLGGLWHKQ